MEMCKELNAYPRILHFSGLHKNEEKSKKSELHLKPRTKITIYYCH